MFPACNRSHRSMEGAMTQKTRCSIPRLAALLALALLLPGTAAATGNPAAGEKKSQYCSTCHGPTGNYTHTGTPRLAGQSAEAFTAMLKQFRAAKRHTHPMMSMLTHGLSDQDIADLAAFYAAQKVENSLNRYTPPPLQ